MLRLVKKLIHLGLRLVGYGLVRLNPKPDHELELHCELFGAEAVAERRFFNIGAGGFRHAAWQNVDPPSEHYSEINYGNIDIEWDISRLQPLPVKDESAFIVYTSHTIEHLMDKHDRHMFTEAYRILKPGGIIRATTPDIDLYYQAYLQNDKNFFPYPETYETHSIQ